MKKSKDKYQFVFDNKSGNWFVIDTQSDKYKFYARVSRTKDIKDWMDNFRDNYKKESQVS